MYDDGCGPALRTLAAADPHLKQDGQKYDPHHDYFSFAAGDDNGGNRCATVLMYLSDVEEGGETVFPKVCVMLHPTPEVVTTTLVTHCQCEQLSCSPVSATAPFTLKL